MTPAVQQAQSRLLVPLLAVTLFLVTGAVNLQMPLYQDYARATGYGTGLTAVMFASYVAGLLPVLILLGGISDRLGRKPVVLAGLGAALAATALMVVWPNMQALFVARVLQGVGVGLCVNAASAYLTQVGGHPTRTARVVAIATALGFGGGALLTTGAITFSGDLVPPSYWFMLAATGLVIVLVAVFGPTLPTRASGLVRLPYFASGTLRPNAAIALAWAISGLVVAIVPAQLDKEGLHLWAGPVLFLVNVAGVVIQPLAGRMPPLRAVRTGLLLLPGGYLLLVIGAIAGSLPLVLAGAVISGTSCYGFTYSGGLAEVGRLGTAEPARAPAAFFLCAYLGFGLPSLLLGFLSEWTGLGVALSGFAAVVLVVVIGLLLPGRKPRSGPDNRTQERDAAPSCSPGQEGHHDAG